MDVIPYGRQQIDDDDIAAVEAVLRTPWLTQGPIVAEFEAAVAQRCRAKHAVACNSGTAALHLAMLAAEVGPGHTILSPALTFLATANCGVYVGASPRFTDIDFDSGLMTAELLEPHLNGTVRAVLPVHFAGAACDMRAIHELVRRRCPQAVIVEDACHALGGSHADGTPIGELRWSDMAVLSFHPVKHIAAGEGGMVLTNEDRLAERLRMFRSHGMTKTPAMLTRPEEGPWYYEMHEVGCNYRIPDLNCALALSQLKKLDRFVARRREIAARYFAALADVPHVTLPDQRLLAQSAWHIFSLHVDFAALGKPRTRVVTELRDAGVGTQVHYYPVPLQPYYRELLGCRESDFPGAERHYAQALTIPLFPAMTDADVERVVRAIHIVFQTESRSVRNHAA